MCGIVGYVGSEGAAAYVLDGLRRLEYRGYDSAGIATVSDDGAIDVRRSKGKLSALTALLAKEPLRGSCAIGHTRWATHGRPSHENAHPHRADDIVVVHNGIIENFLELKAELKKAGRQLTSETDTELIAHIIAMTRGDSLAQRVRMALRRVRGSYALSVLSEQAPQTLVVAKNASPLVLGVLEKGGVVASDIPALLPLTQDIIVLEEDEMAVLRADGIQIMTHDGQPVERASKRISWTPVMAEKGGHRHFMHKEIHEQPRALADTLAGRLTLFGADGIDTRMLEVATEVNRIVLTACGSSYHACLVGRLALEELANIGCEVEFASELRYRKPLMHRDSMVVALSQSGETADTLAAIKESKSRGAKVLSMVNVLESSIARASDWTFYTHAGPEIGVASTKAFITQVASIILLSVAIGHRRGLGDKRALSILEDLRRIPSHIETILQGEDAIKGIAHELAHVRSMLFLGRGYGYPVALEGALKLKEISYIHAQGYASGEMKHGPIALIEPDVPSLFVATKGPLYEKVIANLQEVRARDGKVIAVGTEGDAQLAQVCDAVMQIPRVDDLLMPLLATIPLQLLAYHIADARGTDIDQPRNLAKSVTVE